MNMLEIKENTNSEEKSFREQISDFMDEYSKSIGFTEGFTSSLVSDSMLKTIEDVIKSNKNEMLSSELTSSLSGLKKQTNLSQMSTALGSLSKVIKVLPIVSLANSLSEDWKNGNDYPYETMKTALAITAGIIIGGWCGGLLIPAIAAGAAGSLIDTYWDSIESKFKDFMGTRTEHNEIKPTSESHQSPLVLDLDGDGIVETHKENSTVYFDHDNNGLAESTGWVGVDDGLLVRDLNDNGQIDNGTELFGNNSVLSSGATAANGFEALADLDSNQDGVFNSSDSAWNEVKVWKDANGNGRVDEGELLTLEQAGVSGINLEYQASDLSDENGNAHKQTGSFIKTDGTTGSVHDVWFDADKSDTISKEEIAIPEDIAALPDIEGWGNVRSLREAMALDESGELKALVQQYMSETDPAFRQGMLDNIIFHWTGVEDVDPLSRKPSYFYDNPIGDARYLEAQEQFWGEKYANKWWFGKEEQNPHEQASKILLQGFDIIRDYVSNALESQTHCAGFLENIKLTWNGETQIWEVDVSGAVVLLNTLAENNMDSAVQTLHNLENIIKQQDIMVEEINTAFQAYGSAESYLQLFYDKFGTLENQISNGNDIIYGTEGDNYINGLGGNDKIYGQAGDDMLIGGVGDDYLVGGEGSDTYFFEGFWGHDSIDNSSSDKVGTNPDKILFGEGISPTDVSIQRQGNDLILSLHDGADTVKVYSYFLDAGNTNNTVDTIEFADGTVWDYNHIRVAWNAAPVSVGGFVTKEGTKGNDTIQGSSGSDFLSGNDGNDTIFGNGGNDVLYGGRGNDRLEGGEGDDTYYWNLGDGVDTITDSKNNDAICFGEGINFDNLIFRSEGVDLRILVNGDDNQGLLIKKFLQSDNNYKIEELYFADGSNVHLSEIGLTMHQKKTNNYYDYGTEFDDVIYGDDADEYIMARGGDDIIQAGKGDDTIDGGDGNNIYIYNLSDGLDKIIDDTGTAVVRFGEGITFGDLTFRYQHDNRYLRIVVKGDETQGLLLYWQMNTNYDYYGARYLEFADGSRFDLRTQGFVLQQTDEKETVYGTKFDDVIYGNGGDDSLVGGDGSDSYVWNWGDGLDTISESNVAGVDKIVFGEGISFEDLTFSFQSGGYFQINVKGDETQGVRIVSQYLTGQSKYSDAGIEQLVFADGTTVNLKEIGLTIYQKNNTYAPTQQVYTNGTSYDDIIYGREGLNTIRGYAGNDIIYGKSAKDTLEGGAGNDTLYGGAGDDSLKGNDGDDVLYGGDGNDYLAGGYGADTYYWNWGDGWDYINDEGTDDGIDKIVFGEGITFKDLTFTKDYSGYFQIIVKGDKTQGIELSNQYFTGSTSSYPNKGIEQLVFSDGSIINFKEIGLVIHNENVEFPADKTGNIYGTDYNDVVYGSSGKDYINACGGDDILYGNDGDDRIYGGNGNNRLYGGNGKDYLSAGDGNDYLNGGTGDDTLIAGRGDDILIGGVGNDILEGDYGNDIYYWNWGDGWDSINDSANDEGIDKLVFGEGITFDDLKFSVSHTGYDMGVTIKEDSKQGLSIKNQTEDNKGGIEQFVFADGTIVNIKEIGLTLHQENVSVSSGDKLYTYGTKYNDTIYGRKEKDNIFGYNGNDTLYGNDGDDILNGGNDNDILIGGVGNDELKGDSGNDTYVYNLGDGFDTITDTGGNDKIKFGEGINQNDLSFKTEGQNLKILINNNETAGIQISSQLQGGSKVVETIEFHDGSTLDITNADQLIQAMNSFGAETSSAMETLSDAVENVSDMYSLADNSDLTGKAA